MDAPSSTDPAITARTLLHRGKKFDFEVLTVRRPSGRTLQRENVRHPGAVVIVAILDAAAPKAGKSLVMIRNFRISLSQRLLECCAGTIERPRLDERASGVGGFGPGEAPELCAARELIEETGYKAATLIPLGWFYTTPGLTDEQMYAFAATGLTHVGQDLEEDESIDVEIVPVAEILGMVRAGGIHDAKSMLAILLAEKAGLLA